MMKNNKKMPKKYLKGLSNIENDLLISQRRQEVEFFVHEPWKHSIWNDLFINRAILSYTGYTGAFF